MLIGAFSMQRDNTLLLAQRDHFDSHGDSIADVNGGEKLQGLSQVDASRSWERVAQYRREQRPDQEAMSDAFANKRAFRIYCIKVRRVAICAYEGKRRTIV